MPNFDRRLVYQFVCFFGAPREPVAPDASERLADMISTAVPGGPPVNVVLRSAQVRAQIAVDGGGLTSRQVVGWTGAGGIWKLTLSDQNMDLQFDARGQAEATSTAPARLMAIADRVVANIARASAQLHLPTNRLALVWTGETEGTTSATRFVAERFFSSEMQRGLENGELVECQARVNHRAEWDLPELDRVIVNRIETAASVWSLEHTGPVTRLQRQFDVNTAPALIDETRFSERQIATFFRKAVEWVEARTDAVT